MFVAANMQSLQQEIAQGGGENLAALSELLGCQAGTQFNQAMQKNYSVIFSSANMPVEQILSYVKSTVKSDAQLTKACGA